MNRAFAIILYILFAGLFFSNSCANIGTISGGPKDSIPPVVIASKPVFLDTSFKDDKIVIYFNEYFELKDITQEFLASPPFQENPDFKVKKRGLHIKFKEPLRDSITYTLNFGNAIADFNEGNILKNYRFVFSTKSTIDSFSIAGNLRNAFDLKVPENSLVMIFEKNEDSIPFKSLPDYVSKIDTSGNFSIDFIRPGKYKIFALNDINTNRRADEFEARAFLDSLIIPDREPFTKIDSVKAGSILHDIIDPLLSDSVTRDTVIITNLYNNTPTNLQMYMFNEQNLKQRVLDFSRKERGELNMSLQLPAGPDFQLTPLNFKLSAENELIEKNLTNDTIAWWINDTTVMAHDSLEVAVSYLTRDSLDAPITKTDTILFEFREKKDPNAWKRNKENEKEVKQVEYLKLNYLAKDNKIDLNKQLRIESPTPLLAIDTSKIRLFEIYDTTTVDTKKQKIVKAHRLKKDFLSFSFQRPIVQDFKLTPMNFDAENWYTVSSSDSNKVYNCQITNVQVASMDTLKLLVDYDNHFFFDQIQLLIDTVMMPMSEQKILNRKRPDAEQITLVFDKPLKSSLVVIPDDFTARGNWYQVGKNRTADTITIRILDKNVSNKDTLTFAVKCFDYMGFNNDSVFFEQTMRLTYSERKQFLVSTNRPKKDVLTLIFNKRMQQNPEIKALNFTVNNQWYDLKRNSGGDTLTYSITDNFVSDIDTLKMLFSYKDTDRKGNSTSFSDSLEFLTRKKKDYTPRTTDTQAEIQAPKAETVHVYLPMNYEIQEDTVHIRQRLLNSDWKENTKYKLRLFQQAFTSFYKVFNDNEDYEFATRELNYYSTISLSLVNIKANKLPGETTDSLQVDSLTTDSTITNNIAEEKYIVPRSEIDSVLGSGHLILQLLDKKGEVVIREFHVTEDQEILMDFLAPGDYLLKIIFDRNNNGKWDTGNYFKHIQPERVIMNGTPIQLKSNFENKLEWNVGDYLIKSFTK